MAAKWSEVEIAYLAANCSGLTISELAAALGLSYSSVKGKLWKLGLKAKPAIVAITTESYRETIAGRPITCLSEYVNNATKILHQCKVCQHMWEVKPNDVKSGQGCPSCAKKGFNPNKPAHLYLLLIENSIERFLKIGITNRAIGCRAKQILATCAEDSTLDILGVIYSENGQEIYELEQGVHANKELKRFTTCNVWMDGKTELYDYSTLKTLLTIFSEYDNG